MALAKCSFLTVGTVCLNKATSQATNSSTAETQLEAGEFCNCMLQLSSI